MDTDLADLQGTWQAVRVEVAAGPLTAEAALRLRYVFAGDRVTLLEDGKSSGTGTFTVQAQANPKAIDVAMTEGPASGQRAYGIYRVAGDRLELCIGPQRPAGFRATGSAALVELERVADGG
jgi:uncharacterized protein (TIGR03067 family)